MSNILDQVLENVQNRSLKFRRLCLSDIPELHEMVALQDGNDLIYFRPHGFELNLLIKQMQNPAFLMMGAFDNEKMAGYFFLRFFVNRRCFVGRLIDKEYRGKGIGLVMNTIMYQIAWRMRFRCLSTISRNNTLVMNAHSKNPSMVVLKELKNDYLLVEFLNRKDVS
jgi:RimJ/RimL family protein N-acetyltransferase